MTKLTEYFSGISIKRLSAVETNLKISHQHEFNGAKPIAELFGIPDGKIKTICNWIYFGDDETEIKTDIAQITWYDARLNHPTRTEYRLYYQGNEVIEAANPEDLLIIARNSIGDPLIIICKKGSSYESQLLWLFGLQEVGAGTEFVTRTTAIEREIGLAERLILEAIGIEVPIEEKAWLDQLLYLFGGVFPSTRIFSNFSRQTLQDVNCLDNPDEALVLWLNQEEMLFKTLEQYIVWKRIQEGFNDVDTFVQFSLGVQNRRKSRMGHALENHLEHIFIQNSIRHSKGKVTENNSKPDFIFPGIDKYNDISFPADRLFMLGVKSTCKDRWRQVLTEARRISRKHLFTLEPGISKNQTDEMTANFLQLVLPSGIHDTYSKDQRNRLLNLNQFLFLVSENGFFGR